MNRGLKFLLPSALSAAALLAGGGCSRLLGLRVHHVKSAELIVDTRQDPSESLSGRIIPEVYPALTKWPVLFPDAPQGRVEWIGATCETVSQSGDVPTVLSAVVEHNQVYLEVAEPAVASASEIHVVVHADYRRR